MRRMNLLALMVGLLTLITIVFVIAWVLMATGAVANPSLALVTQDIPFTESVVPPQTTQLESQTPHPPDYPSEKQTLEAKMEQTRRAVTLTPATGLPTYNPPTSAPVTEEPWDWGTGIVESGDAPFSGMVYSIYNRWYGMLNGQRVVVYAGGLRDDPGGVSQTASQGLVIVVVISPVSGEQLPESYQTPIKAGLLRIVAASDDLRLTLDTPNGNAFYFDVPSRQFADSLIATPRPTTTPMPTLSNTPQLQHILHLFQQRPFHSLSFIN